MIRLFWTTGVLFAASTAAIAQDAETGTRTLASYDVISVRNPFSPDRPRKPAPPSPDPKPDPKPEEPKPEPKKVPKKNHTFTAVFLKSGVPTALIERPGKDPLSLNVGDTLLEGTVEQIALDRLVLKTGEQTREILVGERFADGTEMITEGADDPPARPTTTSSGSGGTTSLLTPEEQQLPADERRKLLIQRMKERREAQKK